MKTNYYFKFLCGYGNRTAEIFTTIEGEVLSIDDEYNEFVGSKIDLERLDHDTPLFFYFNDKKELAKESDLYIISSETNPKI